MVHGRGRDQGEHAHRTKYEINWFPLVDGFPTGDINTSGCKRVFCRLHVAFFLLWRSFGVVPESIAKGSSGKSLEH